MLKQFKIRQPVSAIIFASIFCALHFSGTKKVIISKVTDASTLQPLSGVSVTVPITTIGTAANDNDNFF